VEKIEVVLRSDKIDGYLLEGLRTFGLTTLSILITMRMVPDRIVVDFFPAIRAIFQVQPILVEALCSAAE
jgi:hypothetical protein